MTRDEVLSFCQFLVQKKAVRSETIHGLLSDSAMQRLAEQPARQAAISIVQHIMFRNLWLVPNTMPEKVVDAWMAAQAPSRSPSGRQASQPVPSGVQPQPPAAPPRPAVDDDGYESTQALPGRGKQAQPAAPVGVPADRIDRYRIVGKIGEGGMGAVFRGRDDNLGIDVAIKIIKPDLVSPEEAERFRREAQVTAALASPHLVRIYTADFRCKPPYIAMECIQGESLDKAMGKKRPSGDMLWRIETMARVCDGVAVMHAHGVVHRDLKPGNIMVDQTGRPVVLDLGLVKPLKADDPEPQGAPPRPGNQADVGLTQTGTVAGTPMFMPPEQAFAELEKIGTASDVYSLGKILFLVLTGTHVHVKASFAAIMDALLNPFPDEAEKIFRQKVRAKYDPDRLLAIIKKCMAQEPGDRYPDAAALAKELRSYSHWLSTHEEEQARMREAAAERQRKLLTGGLAVFAAAAIGFAVVAIFFAKARREAQARAEAEAKAADEAEARAEVEAQAAETARQAEAAQRVRNETSAQFLVCQSLMKASKWEEAERRLQAIVERDGSYEPARYALAQVQFNLMKPACVEQWQWLVQHGSAERRPEYCFYAIFHAEQLDPSDEPGRHERLLGLISDEQYLALGSVYLKLIEGQLADRRGNWQRCRNLLKEAEGEIPSLSSGHELAWLADALRGFLIWRYTSDLAPAERTARLREAYAYLERSAAQNPDFPMTHQWLGDTLLSLRDLRGAAAAFLRYECLMPGPVARYQKLSCQLELATLERDFDRVLTLADEATRVCGEMLAGGKLRGRQPFFARMTLLKAEIDRSGVYRQRREWASLRESRTRVLRLIEELMADRDILPDETVELFQAQIFAIGDDRDQEIWDPQLMVRVTDGAVPLYNGIVNDERTSAFVSVRCSVLLVKAYIVRNKAFVRLRDARANEAFSEARRLAQDLLNQPAVRDNPQLLTEEDRVFLQQVIAHQPR